MLSHGRCDSAPIAIAGTNPIENAKTDAVITALNKNQLIDTIPNDYEFVSLNV